MGGDGWVNFGGQRAAYVADRIPCRWSESNEDDNYKGMASRDAGDV